MPGLPAGAPRFAWLAAPEAGPGAWWRFATPRGALAAASPAEVPALLAELERAAARGLWAVGFVAYEAAPAFDAALAVRAGPRPGRRSPPSDCSTRPSGPRLRPRRDGRARVSGLAPALGEAEHAAAIAAVRAAIARGDTYQVNFTFPLHGRLRGLAGGAVRSARAGRARALRRVPRPAAQRAIVSLSPELFFEREGDRLRHASDEGDPPAGPLRARRTPGAPPSSPRPGRTAPRT